MTAAYDDALLLAHIEGQTSEAESAKVQRLIDQDPRLGRLLAQMKADRMALLSLPMETAPTGMIEDILAGQERQALLGEPVGAAPAAAPAQRVYHFTRVLGYLAAAAAIGLCGTVLFDVLRSPSEFENASSGLDQLVKNDGPGEQPIPEQPVSEQAAPITAKEQGAQPKQADPSVASTTPTTSSPPLIATATDQPVDTKDAKPSNPTKAGLMHAAQPRQLNLLAECQDPQSAQAALFAWAESQGLEAPRSLTAPDGSQTFFVAWRSDADLQALKTSLREEGLARFAQEGSSPLAAAEAVSTGPTTNELLANTQTIAEPSTTATLNELSAAAQAAQAVGLAIAYAHNEPIQLDDPNSLMRLLDHASGGYASGAELGMALGSVDSVSRWITDTPTIDQSLGPVIRVTIKSTPPQTPAPEKSSDIQTKALPSLGD